MLPKLFIGCCKVAIVLATGQTCYNREFQGHFSENIHNCSPQPIQLLFFNQHHAMLTLGVWHVKLPASSHGHGIYARNKDIRTFHSFALDI